jgi:hypothetical protein
MFFIPSGYGNIIILKTGGVKLFIKNIFAAGLGF